MSLVSHLLNATADVYRRQTTDDGMGGVSVTYSQVATVRARYSPSPGGIEREVGGESGETQMWNVYLDTTADVRRGDELHRGDLVYLVMSTVEPSVPGTYLLAVCRYRQPVQ